MTRNPPTSSQRRLSSRALAVAVTLALTAGWRPATADTGRAPELAMGGEVIRVALESDGEQVVCRIDLRLTVVNVGDEAVILVRPWHHGGRWFGGVSLSRSAEEARAGRALVKLYLGESFSTGPEYHELARRLDQPAPPDDVTLTIAPGSSWVHDTAVDLVVYERHGMQFPDWATWDEVVALGTSHWLRVVFEVWPFNVESVRPDFGSELAERWRGYGRLFLEEPAVRRRHFAALVSEPIALDLAAAEGFGL